MFTFNPVFVILEGQNLQNTGDIKLKTSMKSINCGELNLANLNEELTLCGWVSTVRDLGGILFIELRDRSGFFQLVANPQINPEVHAEFSKLKSEYVIQVTGKISKDRKKHIMKNILQDKLKCILRW